MASYILTDNEVKAFLQQADMYIEAESSYRTWAPIRTCPWASTNEWYVLTRFEVPRGSEDGRDWVEVQTARTSATANQISYTYKFNIPYGDVEQSRQHGIPIWSDNVQVAAKQLDMTIAHLACEGNFSWDPVAINGLRDGGTEDANDADAWNTVTQPIDNYLLPSIENLNSAGFHKPYTLLLSNNLEAGLLKKYGAGDPPHIDMLAGIGIDRLAFLPIGTSDRDRVYPIGPADNDDGVMFLYKQDTSVWRIAEVGPPTTKLIPELNEDTNSFEGYMRWRGTVEIVQATGIRYDPDVDLA
jgi:hypothetical protein